MKRAVAAWSSRRRARGSVPYAVSRIRMCLNAYSVSPSTRLSARRSTRPRASSASSAASMSSTSPSPSTTLRQNVTPITEALSSAVRATGDSASTRAAIAARTVAGSSSAFGSSSSAATSSSMNSGLPPAVATTRSIAPASDAGSSAPTISAVSPGVSGLERQRRVADHAGAPVRPAFEELGPRERDEHDAVVAHVRHEVVDQLEQRVVRPVQVLEHEQERFAFGQMLEQLPDREQQVDRLVRRLVEPQTQQQRQVPRGLRDVGSREQRPRQRRELVPRLRHGFGLEDPRGGPHHLGRGAVRALLLVGQAPARELAAALGPDVLGDLVREP